MKRSRKPLELKDLRKDMLVTNNHDIASIVRIDSDDILLMVEPNIGYTYHKINVNDPLYECTTESI